jgi:hypothetical protein
MIEAYALARGHFPQGADWEGRWRDGADRLDVHQIRIRFGISQGQQTFRLTDESAVLAHLDIVLEVSAERLGIALPILLVHPRWLSLLSPTLCARDVGKYQGSKNHGLP